MDLLLKTQIKIAILNDYHNTSVIPFSSFGQEIEIKTFKGTLLPFSHPFTPETIKKELVERLKPLQIISIMRERTPSPFATTRKTPQTPLARTSYRNSPITPRRRSISVFNSLSVIRQISRHQDSEIERPPNASEAILESLAPIITPEMRQEVITTSKLPHCPKYSSLLRPGVVWSGELLSQSMFDEINEWIDSERNLDLMMVIGTMDEVYPTAMFVQRAAEKGARIAC